ncbi:MAG: ABC transporter permease [Paracoccus sp. (in: a-proteobacteria)]|jgi:ribose transport system permease protein
MNRNTLLKWAPLLVLVLLIALFTAVNANFLSVRNFARLATAAAPPLMVALGVTFIIVMGSIDLSMEGTVSLTAVLFCMIYLALGDSLLPVGWVALPLTLLTGTVIGALVGLLHVRLRIPSFMASLAMGFVGTGAAILITGGAIVRIQDEAFRGLLTVRFLQFPLMCWLALVCFLAAWFIQTKTTLGRNFYAVGGGEELAHASGLNVKRVRIMGFALAGTFYAIAAIMMVARLGQAESTTGANMMFTSVTSVVVGGVALWGGIGGVWNALVGVLIVTVISNGMVVAGLPTFIQDGVLGVLVIIAVVLSTDRRSISFVK